MAVISITTSQNIELEYDLASLGERIVAAVIDIVIIIGYIILIGMFTNFSDRLNYNYGWVYLFLFLPVTFYSLLCETFLNGQSVGKKVMGVKVISLNGNPASFGQYLIRWLFRLVDLWIGSFVLAVIMIAVTENHQRVGDLVAGTAVVRTRPRMALQETLYTPIADLNYEVNYPEVTKLSDSDMQLIKEVLINVQKSGNTPLAIQTMEKIESILNIRSHHDDPVVFLRALLSDYNHLTAKM